MKIFFNKKEVKIEIVGSLKWNWKVNTLRKIYGLQPKGNSETLSVLLYMCRKQMNQIERR
jgi:hypothetical protein